MTIPSQPPVAALGHAKPGQAMALRLGALAVVLVVLSLVVLILGHGAGVT